MSDKNTNRRIAFRIYERVNLFYHKIDPADVKEPLDGFNQMLKANATPAVAQKSTIHPFLPASQSLENDTLNVNISATGIAFTCKEALKQGDYLMTRILLLSSMTVVMICCKVVYCKPSNPYEVDRYPYLIGAQFVNQTAEDNALLNKHVCKHRNQQGIVYGLLLFLAFTVLAIPDVVFGLLLQLAHYVLEIALHLMHLAFEFVEYNLDHFIEHTFHTDLHTTQVIAFYTLFTLGIGILYLLWRIVPSFCRRLVNKQLAFWGRKKASFAYFWGEQTLVDKLKILGVTLVVIAGYLYLGM